MEMKKWVMSAGAMLVSMMLFAGIASAHVTVLPKEATAGSYEVFTVRVPSEKEVATVKVEVKIPVDVDISRFEPKPGWKYDVTRDDKKKITSVVWTATGDGFSATEFGEFKMQGKIADTAKELSWKAYQTYKDNSVAEWTGAADSKTPASVTSVKAKPASATTDSHGHTADHAASDEATSDSKATFYLSIAALVLGLVALITSLTKKAK